MTIEKVDGKKGSLRKRNLLKFILVVIYLLFLIWFYNILINFGASILLAILILFFIFLIFLGVLVKGSNISFISIFKRNKSNNLNENNKKRDFLKGFEKYPQMRRVDYIDIKSKYRKPLVRKCSNCGVLIPGFVKRCPNCGEQIYMS